MKSRFLLFFATSLLWVGLVFAQVNINTASVDELDGLKGIGPTKAKAIVDYRKKNGPFKAVDDLQNVPGIWPSILKNMRKDVMVSGASRAPVSALPVPSARTKEPATPRMAAPARPAAPAMPGKTMSSPPPALEKPAAPAAPVKPAAPATPARPAMPSMAPKPATESKPSPVAPAAPMAKPAAPAAPARPAQPAGH